MFYEWIGFVIVAIFGFFLTTIPITHRFPKRLAQLLFIGFILRVIGSLIRYYVLYKYYDGGDAGPYFRIGYQYAQFLWNLDFSFFNRHYWATNNWWGTQMMMFISGFVLSLIGPSQRGEFLFFSMMSFVALLFFAKSFEKNYPLSDIRKYALFLLVWPSLWFWPSSVGKDAVVLLATGLVVYGYTSKRTGIRWMALVLGLALAGAIRPHVAGVMVVSIAIAHWVSPGKRWNTFHYIQGFIILILLFFVLRQSLSQLGLDELDVENLKNYVENVSQRTTEGGSAIQTPGLSITGIPIAFVNILFRPFPWEAGSIMTAAASAELLLFWTLVWMRRKRIVLLMAEWRYTKLLRLAVPLTILYILMLGMAVGNLGIIARQRIHILPLLFIWLEAQPYALKRRLNLPKSPFAATPYRVAATDVDSRSA